MKRIVFLGFLFFFVCGLIFSQDVPASLRNNRYYMESLRLTALAQESYEFGDFDSSAAYAEEALRYAQLSDEYVALQLKIKETDSAIAAAKGRIDWAAQVGADQRNPEEYAAAEQAYGEAVACREDEAWDEAIAAANRVVDFLAYIDGSEPALVEKPAPVEEPAPAVIVEEPAPVAPVEKPVLRPAQYTVRPWAVSKDCFWNIAGRSWVYGDPYKWRLIYNANKGKLPDPNNPEIIEPGIVLDIPSLQGESREGLWDADKTYPPIK
jgi:nucleoid-associated protein YgaU